MLGPTVILLPLAAPGDWPASRRALLQALAGGRLPEPLEQHAVKLALGGPAAEGISFNSLRVLNMLLDQIIFDAAGVRGAIPDAAKWLLLLVHEHIRVSRTALPDQRPAWHMLSRLAGYPTTSAVVGPIIRRVLNEVPGEDGALARQIMDEGQGSMSSTSAAVSIFGDTGEEDAVEEVDAGLLEAIRRQLESVINFPWLEPVFAVDLRALIGTASRVEFTKLDKDDKVRAEGEVLHVEREAFDGMIRGSRDQESTLALASLYLVHELVHVAQGIGDKDAVTRLRSTGGETTLMHVDLSADHAAALAVARAEPRWTVSWLKDFQGRSLDDFPARWTHTEASRARKAARLVGLRVDYLARRQGVSVPPALASGYLFADFGPAGGSFLLMAGGPPTSMLGSAPLGREDAEVLARAADEANANPKGLARVDEVLLRALTSIKGLRAQQA